MAITSRERGSYDLYLFDFWLFQPLRVDRGRSITTQVGLRKKNTSEVLTDYYKGGLKSKNRYEGGLS